MNQAAAREQNGLNNPRSRDTNIQSRLLTAGKTERQNKEERREENRKERRKRRGDQQVEKEEMKQNSHSYTKN